MFLIKIHIKINEPHTFGGINFFASTPYHAVGLNSNSIMHALVYYEPLNMNYNILRIANDWRQDAVICLTNIIFVFI